MSSCPDLRNQLDKCKNTSALMQMLVDCSGASKDDWEKFEQEFKQKTSNTIGKNTWQLRQNVKELDYKGNLDLSEVTDYTQLQEKNGFIFPRSVSGALELDGLTSARGLVLPKKIGEFLSFNNLLDAEELVLPEEIGGGLHLIQLANVEELVLPKIVHGTVFLQHLKSAEKLVLPREVGQDLNLGELTKARGVTWPEKVGGILDIDDLSSAEGLVLPEQMDGLILISKPVYDELALKLTPEELQKYKFRLTKY